MIVKAKCDFLHDQLGRVRKGQELSVTDRQLKQLQGFGWVDIPVELYHTKVVTDSPLSGRGEIAPSSASPAAQVSEQTTLQPSNRGRKKRQHNGE
jgi:hypothetical protein